MCLAVYIASDHELPLIAWDESAPSFYIDELSTDGDVKKQFTLPEVAYAGSHEGCGCGFLKDGAVGEELEDVDENYHKLASYIKGLQTKGASIQLFSCWEGEQTSPAESNETIRVSDLMTKEFEFKEKALYRLNAG